MPTSRSVTADLARACVDLEYEDLPRAVKAIAKQCVLDTFGVTIAGVAQPVHGLVWDVVGDGVDDGPCTVLGNGRRAPGTIAALMNGVAAHALDFDDMHMAAMGGHPSAPLLPAVLAAAEATRASGAALLTAFVAGFEVQCRIGLSLAPTHYGRGFHTTATVGTFGAAAGAARMLGLDEEAVEHALGIAALSASGLKLMFGGMGKPLQVGRASSSGLLAAQLSAHGVTSAPDSLAQPQGFAAAHADAFDHSVARTPFGSPWHILDVLFKSHASCYGTHASIEASLRLREQISPEDIQGIEVRVPAEQLTVCAVPQPSTGLEGKFSLAFTTALALARGRTDDSQFTDRTVGDSVLIELASRVRVVADDDQPPLGAHVSVMSRDGRRFSLGVDAGVPAWSRDPSEQDERIQKKFRALVVPVRGPSVADALIEMVTHLEEIDDIRSLTKEL